MARSDRHPEAGESLAIGVRRLRRDGATGERQSQEQTVQTLTYGGLMIVPLIVICWAADESANPWVTTRASPWDHEVQ